MPALRTCSTGATPCRWAAPTSAKARPWPSTACLGHCRGRSGAVGLHRCQLQLLNLRFGAVRHAATDASRAPRQVAEDRRRAAGFDFDFDLTDAGRVYGTELVWRALREPLGEYPLPDKPRVNSRPAVMVESLLREMPELRLVRIAAPGDGRSGDAGAMGCGESGGRRGL